MPNLWKQTNIMPTVQETTIAQIKFLTLALLFMSIPMIFAQEVAPVNETPTPEPEPDPTPDPKPEPIEEKLNPFESRDLRIQEYRYGENMRTIFKLDIGVNIIQMVT